MKKVIAATAGLMLAGTMASSAFAMEPGVTFSGDARARFYAQEEYKTVDSSDTHWNSRVRLKWKAVAKGGAYAVGRFRLADSTWDGTQQTDNRGEGSNLYTDYAYIGVPMGPATVEAGLMPRDLTRFLEWDTRVDSVQVKFPIAGQTAIAFYEITDEYEEDEEGNVLESDDNDDNDTTRFGAWYNFKFAEGMGLTLVAAYQNDDQAADETGFFGSILFDGTFGATGIAAELAMKESDLVDGDSDDDALGFYVKANFGIAAVNIGAILGFTADGYEADGDYGPFIMMSDDSQIATGKLIGSGGDTTFFGLTADFQATETLGFGLLGAYYDQDVDGDAYEIGATASYAISDGAKLNGVIGYLDQDEKDNAPFGFGLSLEISY